MKPRDLSEVEIARKDRPSRKIAWRSLFRKPFQLWPTRALIIQAHSLHGLIFAEDTFSVHDRFAYEDVCDELATRGYECVEAAEFRKRGRS
jgi:hypothetical protein